MTAGDDVRPSDGRSASNSDQETESTTFEINVEERSLVLDDSPAAGKMLASTHQQASLVISLVMRLSKWGKGKIRKRKVRRSIAAVAGLLLATLIEMWLSPSDIIISLVMSLGIEKVRTFLTIFRGDPVGELALRSLVVILGAGLCAVPVSYLLSWLAWLPEAGKPTGIGLASSKQNLQYLLSTEADGPSIKNAFEKVYDANCEITALDAGRPTIEPRSQDDETTIVACEYKLKEDNPGDGLLRDDTPREIVGEADHHTDSELGFPLDKAGGRIANTDFEMYLQVVARPRPDLDSLIDHRIDRLEFQRERNSRARAANQRQNEQRQRADGGLPSDKEERLTGFKEAKSMDEYYGVNVRAIAIVSSADEKTNAVKKMKGIAKDFNAITNAHSHINCSIGTSDSGWLWVRRRARRITERFNQCSVEESTLRRVFRKQRDQMIADEETIWTYLLLPGKGSAPTRAAHETKSKAQSPTRSPNDSQTDYLTGDGTLADQTTGDDGDDASDAVSIAEQWDADGEGRS